MKERPKHSIVRRFWKIGHYGAICFALLFGLTFASGVRQAHAAEVTVTDMISLFDQMNNNEDGSTIVLGADIDNGLDGWPISVFPEESVTIDLAGHKLTLQTTAESMAPALAISAGASLTVIDSSPDKTGELIADSSAVPGAAGIGWCRDCYWEGAGTITIAGGTVKATGGVYGAGIGGGTNVIINGGTVIATGGLFAAGIGGNMDNSGGIVTINGGNVTAIGGEGGQDPLHPDDFFYYGGGAGIGGGADTQLFDVNNGGTLTINGGIITATGGSGAAGIGGGEFGNGGMILITDGDVTAKGGYGGAGIGGGTGFGDNSAFGSGGNVTIKGGTVKATGGVSAAGIGGGGGRGGLGGTVTIDGGTITANGGEGEYSAGGAGIGGGAENDGGNITINNGTVAATGGAGYSGQYPPPYGGGAGIGGGGGEGDPQTQWFPGGGGGTVTINEGNVTATGGDDGISGNGNDGGAGIGGGSYNGSGAQVTINGGTVTPKGGDGGWAFGAGGNTGSDAFGSLTNGGTIVLPDGSVLLIPPGVTVTNDGTITSEGTIQNNGAIAGQGSIQNNGVIAGTGIIENGDGVSGLVSVLSFDLNGGGGAAPDDIRVFASSLAEAGITLPTPVRPGYTFSGWYTDASSGTRISGTDTIDADRILYAHWNEKPSVIIGMSDTALKSGETATLTFTFSERPTGFAANDITAPTGSLGPLSSIIDNGDGTFGYTILYTPNAGIEDDTNVVTVGTGWTDEEGAGPETQAVSGNYAIDTKTPAAPGLMLAADTGVSSSDGITGTGTVNVTGMETGAGWEYSTNGGGSWHSGTGTSFVLTEGNYAYGDVKVRQADAAGNIGAAGSLSGTVKVDATAPTAPWLALAADTGSSDSDGVTSTGEINVTGLETGAAWEYSTDAGQNWHSGTGTNVVLAEGDYASRAVQVRQTDAAGNVSTVGTLSGAVKVDVFAPVAPGLALAADTGSSTSDGVTNNGAVNVTGLETGAAWEYSTDSGQNWYAGAATSFVLAEGNYAPRDVSVRQTDTAGNSGAVGTLSSTVKIDASAPTAPGLALDADTGNSASDGVTNNGTVNVTGLENDAAWEYSTNAGQNWHSGTGASFVLAEGDYASGDVRARQTDAAGNVGAAGSLSGTVKADDSAPSSPDLALAVDTGSSASDGVTSNGAVSVTGLETGAAWEYSTDNGQNWHTGTGTSLILAEGNYAAGDIRVRQTDAAGNTGPDGTAPDDITIDRTTPEVTITLSVAAIKAGGNAVVTFTFSENPIGFAADDITALNGELSALPSLTDNGNGTFSYTTTFTPDNDVEDDTNRLMVGTGWGDTAGNAPSNIAESEIYAIDTLAPAAPRLSLAADTGVLGSDGITNNGTVTVTGVEVGAAWEYSSDGGHDWESGTGAGFILPEDVYTAGGVRVRQTDAAGNTGPEGQLTAVTVDQTTPIMTISLSDPALNIGETAIVTFAFTEKPSGFAEDDATVENGVLGALSDVIDNGAGTFIMTTVFTPDSGTEAVSNVISVGTGWSDAAGNAPASDSDSGSFVIDTMAPAMPVLTLVADSGASGDGITNDGTISIAGLEAGASWTYSIDGGENWSTGSGTSFLLPEESYEAGRIRARQTDAPGNDSPDGSLPDAITVDVSVPAAPELALATDSGANGDGITNDGTIEVAGLEPDAGWAYSSDSGQSWNTGSGTSFQLPEGNYMADVIQLLQTDRAGSTGPAGSLTIEVMVDQTAPSATIALSDSAFKRGESATVTFTFSEMPIGFAADDVTSPNATLGALSSMIGNGDGTFSYTATVTPDDSVNAEVNAIAAGTGWSDTAGNAPAAVSSSGNYTVDTLKPSVLGLALAIDSGAAGDGITSDGTVIVTGLETDSIWTYSTDGGETWNAGAGDSFELPEGSYEAGDVQARQTDAAGNTGPEGVLPGYAEVDATAPVAPVLAIANDSGEQGDGITNDGTVVVTGMEAGEGWAHSTDGGLSWNIGTGASFALPEGSYGDDDVRVRQTDTAGNTGPIGYLRDSWTVDVTPPTVTVELSDPTLNAYETATVTFTFSENPIDFAADDVTAPNGALGTLSSVVNNGDGTYSVSVIFTPDDGIEASGGVLSVGTGWSDVAGNAPEAGAYSESYAVDTAVPETPGLALAADTGVPGDGLTKDGTMDISNVESGAGWAYSLDGGQTWTPGSGSGFVLPEGSYEPGQVRVRQTDATGNIGSAEAWSEAVTVDRTPPASPGLALAIDSGGKVGDGVTNDGTVNVSGLESANEWIYSTNGGQTWQEGTDSRFILVEGSYANGAVQASQTDLAGNTGPVRLLGATIVDRTAPDIVFSPDRGSMSVQSAETAVTVTNGTGDLDALQFLWTPTADDPDGAAAGWSDFGSGDTLTHGGDGNWYLHVHAVDLAGNATDLASGCFVLDNTIPVITLNGDNPFYVPVGQLYAEPGAAAADNLDGQLLPSTIAVTGIVDTNTMGPYELQYAASDTAGNTATVTRSVYVYDGESPIIRLNGPNPLVIAAGGSFTDPGATAFDAQEGDLTSAITVTGSVYANEVGMYPLIYEVTDSAQNAAPTVTRAVYVNAPPAIGLLGPSAITITVGDTFTDPGATAADSYYGDLTGHITVAGRVLADLPGSYTLRYNVQNPIGQVATEVIRTITVVSAENPDSSDDPGGSGNPGGPDDPGGPGDPDGPDNPGGPSYPSDPGGPSGPGVPGGPSGPGRPAVSDDPNTDVSATASIRLGGVLTEVRMTTETDADGKPVTRLYLTPEQIALLFDDGQTEADIAVEGLGPVVKVSMPAEPLLSELRDHSDARLRVVVNGNGLLVPLSAVGKLHVEATLTATIVQAADAASDALNKTIASQGATPLLRHPVSFALDADGKAVDGWDGAYRERTISLSAVADPNHTTAVWIDAQGGLHFVPAMFGQDSSVATIEARQDGLYTIVESDESFADVQTHWAKNDVELLANKRIVQGEPDGEFVPDALISRAEFAALLVRALGLPEPDEAGTAFTDVQAADWHAGVVGAAREAGLISGFEDGSFRPDAEITREQMAAMIARALAFAGKTPPADAASLESFSDGADVADLAADATSQLIRTGIVQGMTATTFVPQADATRAQGVVMLKRMLQFLQFIDA